MALPIFFLYLFLCGHLVRKVVVGFFNFSASFGTTVLSVFFGFFTLGFWLSVPLLFTTLTFPIVLTAFGANLVMWGVFAHWVHRRIRFELSDEEVVFEAPQDLGATLGVIIYALLVVWAFVLLYQSKTGGVLVSPWKTIDSLYIPVFTAATLVLGLVSLSKIKTHLMVFLFVVHTLLLHSYTPLTHELFYGADGWRHIGSITTILEERPLIQAVLSEAPSIGARLGILTYGQFWSLIAVVARASTWSLYSIFAWMVPLLSAIIIPLFCYELAKLFSLSRRGTFYLLWASLVPFALQAIGAFTLPVSFGFLGWLMSLLLIFKRLKDPRHEQVIILSIIAVLWVFGYSLFSVLFWFGWALAEALLRARTSQRHSAVVVGGVFAGIILLPFIEFVLKYSHLAPINFLKSLQQIVGTFSGWYLASGPRPHDIAVGNILFNQVPDYAFVETIFTKTLWWLPVAALIFFISAKLGTIIALRSKDKLLAWWGIMAAGLTVSYVVSRYFLVGEQVFTRRLDAVLALCFIVVIVIRVAHLEREYSNTHWWLKLLPLFLIIDTVIIGASYTLGPDTNTVSVDQLRAMEYVWNSDKDASKHCVIADTYPLLALEALSGRRVIGGGFPINQYFAQPELQRAWKKARETTMVDMQSAEVQSTGSNTCWLVVDAERAPPVKPTQEVFNVHTDSLGEWFGTVYVQRFTR